MCDESETDPVRCLSRCFIIQDPFLAAIINPTFPTYQLECMSFFFKAAFTDLDWFIELAALHSEFM